MFLIVFIIVIIPSTFPWYVQIIAVILTLKIEVEVKSIVNLFSRFFPSLVFLLVASVTSIICFARSFGLVGRALLVPEWATGARLKCVAIISIVASLRASVVWVPHMVLLIAISLLFWPEVLVEMIILFHLVVNEHEAFIVDEELKLFAMLREPKSVRSNHQLMFEWFSHRFFRMYQAIISEQFLWPSHNRVFQIKAIANVV